MVDEPWHDAGLEVAYQWYLYTNAPTPLAGALALGALNNAMSDLKTWLPGWDGETGTMPWERGEDGE